MTASGCLRSSNHGSHYERRLGFLRCKGLEPSRCWMNRPPTRGSLNIPISFPSMLSMLLIKRALWMYQLLMNPLWISLEERKLNCLLKPDFKESENHMEKADLKDQVIWETQALQRQRRVLVMSIVECLKSSIQQIDWPLSWISSKRLTLDLSMQRINK